MVCDYQIHNDLTYMGESTCPYCDQLLVKDDAAADPCCSEQGVSDVDGMNVCLNCGLVHSCVYADERINFYENIYRIHRKSVYHRKYHIENVLNNICFENRVKLSHNKKDRIFKIFNEIGTAIPLLNFNRKRMISSKFIIKQIFLLFGIPFNVIEVTKSKKTLKFYNRYWVDILLLRFDRIINIIRK